MTDNEHEGMKKCTKCGEWKPATAEYFYRDKTKKGGMSSLCKDCDTASARVYSASSIGRLGSAVNKIRRKTGATICLRDMTDEEKETLANQYVAVRTLEKTEKELLSASGKKRCPACDRILDYSCFYKNITRKDGACVWCRECVAEYSRERYQQNKDKFKEYNRERYQQNKDKTKEHRREYSREYYEKNKDKIREQYQQNKDKINERRRQARQQKNKKST